MEISITRALAQIKLIDKKLQGGDYKLAKVAINGVLVNASNQTPQDFLKYANGVLDSRADLRKKKRALKGAVAKANVQNTIKIGKEELSIIEAIEYKGIVSAWIDELSMMIACLDEAAKIKEKEEAKTEEKAQKTLESIYGTAKNTLPKDTIEQTLKSFRDAYKIEIISPLTLEKAIAQKDELVTLLSEIDLSLSEINAKTMIEI
ncbi:hypothetical protein OFO10_03365 [Campylobacter sp. VBCF_06 NA8]|uniref:hypothetical protein n=1 Tax=Campylobacter sp. VBCF_06 NA8 TaxID=2983822 RepID=UPI0022E9CB04|nr:hypothetical protein [Campylobacter sp. VBCF_06 NA8]MDA3046187.1 hypothetical protein [Campylobacter sp. VBCF_06 NA8]